uniref:Uncharacterized protein n=1 Tax=Rhizophora mucronata TaxID=61149 RepID=A0A2P2INQ7_RHIMU
MISKHRASV